MSKIDEFNNQKSITGKVRKNLYRALGLTEDGSSRDERNDKHRLKIYYRAMSQSDSRDAVMELSGVYGYYGSSSGFSAMDKETASYIARAINDSWDRLVDLAIRLAENDLVKTRKAAEEEARRVLEVVS